jgi:hypothetical protein
MIEYNSKNILNSYHLFLNNNKNNLKNKNLIFLDKLNFFNPYKKNLYNEFYLSRKNSYNIYVYIHYGIICLKRLVTFFSNKIIIQGKIYSLDNVKYNNNLYEITISPKIILRIQYSSIYEFIKNLQNKKNTAIYYNNLI